MLQRDENEKNQKKIKSKKDLQNAADSGEEVRLEL